MRAMIGGIVGAGPCPRPSGRATTTGRPYVGLMLCGLLACGPGSVVPDDDAQGDDDASISDDDLAGDDDAATGGTGTISVTVEVLAVLAEGQTVEAEIVVDGAPTGITAPAEMEVDAGKHTVTLKANEPAAPVPERFVAAPHEVSVSRDGTVACPMFLGRDLGGMWRLVEVGGSTRDDDPFEVRMDMPGPSSADPCPTNLWSRGWDGGLGALCLLSNDHMWYQNSIKTAEGSILDSGSRMEYTFTIDPEGGAPPGPYVFTREE